MADVKELICGYCKDTTKWPAENEIEMMVYGMFHIVDCPNSPVELKAEVIVDLEGYRMEGEGHGNGG